MDESLPRNFFIFFLLVDLCYTDQFKETINAPIPKVRKQILNKYEDRWKYSDRRERRSVCGSESLIVADEKDESVNIHNYLRGQENAANELLMIWSDELSSRAQEWSEQCIWEHGMMTDCSGKYIGQNLYMIGGGSYYPELNITHAAIMWAEERQHWQFSSKTCTPDQICGHWTQLVWAKSLEIGCAYSKCPQVQLDVTTSWNNAIILVCNYRPGGNIRGEDIFITGPPCSACKDVTDNFENQRGFRCYENLCIPCTPRTDESCHCGEAEQCENDGIWSDLDCVCKCPPGFYGVRCSNSCDCVDRHVSACQLWEYYCHEPLYFELMKNMCPKTCNSCTNAEFC